MNTPTRVCCPECHGRCCRLHGHAGGGDITHTDDEENDYSRHICPNCWDGTVLAGSAAALAGSAPTCATCRFHRDGRCYRYPPSPERGRPLVASDDFCGEWSKP